MGKLRRACLWRNPGARKGDEPAGHEESSSPRPEERVLKIQDLDPLLPTVKGQKLTPPSSECYTLRP